MSASIFVILLSVVAGELNLLAYATDRCIVGVSSSHLFIHLLQLETKKVIVRASWKQKGRKCYSAEIMAGILLYLNRNRRGTPDNERCYLTREKQRVRCEMCARLEERR